MPLDPAAKAFLDEVNAADAPGWDEMTPVRAREIFASWTELFGTGPELAIVHDLTLGGSIPARLYQPGFGANDPLPVLMFFHGGGWVLGDLDTHDALCRNLAATTGRAVVAVDYRKPPEHRHPAAVDDCLGATCAIAETGRALGLDTGRIALCGDSAGGNLAAAVALKCRDTNGPAIEAQVLTYPVIAPEFDSPSYREFAEAHGLTRANMRWFWEQYCRRDLSLVDAYASPIRADSLSGLPPALVIVAGYDVLRSEIEAFAERLQADGTSTTVIRYDGMIHGFFQLAAVFPQSAESIERIGEWLSR